MDNDITKQRRDELAARFLVNLDGAARTVSRFAEMVRVELSSYDEMRERGTTSADIVRAEWQGFPARIADTLLRMEGIGDVQRLEDLRTDQLNDAVFEVLCAAYAYIAIALGLMTERIVDGNSAFDNLMSDLMKEEPDA